jgi:predicted GNAT family acetyltransferase
MLEGIRFTTSLDGVTGELLRTTMIEGEFDNGRTPEQYTRAYESSARVIFAWDGDKMVGTARALSDGVSNAYVVDVWTHPDYRRRGIGRRMMELIEEGLPGQHVALFTDDQVEFYASCGYDERGPMLQKVVGEWLQNG